MGKSLVIKSFSIDSNFTAPAGVKSVVVRATRPAMSTVTHSGRNPSSSAWAGSITAQGELYMVGFNTSGRLGDNTTTSKSSPVLVVGSKKWLRVDTGYDHSVALDQNGDAYAWGSNAAGGLGDNTGSDRSSPTLIVGGLKYRFVSSNGQGSLLVDTGGNLYAVGEGTSGSLGDNTTTSKSSPVLVLGGLKWKFSASAGATTTAYGIDTNDDLYAWGDNTSGKLGRNNLTNTSSPVLVLGGRKWKQIKGGNNFCVGLTTDGDLFAWGDGTSGALGNNSTANQSSPVAVLGGLKFKYISPAVSNLCQHTVAVTTDGDAYAWGLNSFGQLGDGTVSNRSSPVLVLGGLKWIQTAAGNSCSSGSDTQGRLWSWGNNESGSLGQPANNNNTSSPVLVAGDKMVETSFSKRLNSVVVSVTPGTSYAIKVLAAGLSIGGAGAGTFYGRTEVVLEYYA